MITLKSPIRAVWSRRLIDGRAPIWPPPSQPPPPDDELQIPATHMARKPIHPGETPREDLDALGMSAAELARRIE